MAVANGISIEPDESRVSVDQLTINDPDVVDYLSEFEPDRRGRALERALKIGASALRLVETDQEIEMVERRFGELETEFNDQLEELVDELDAQFDQEHGRVPRILENHLGEDGHLEDHFEDAFGEEGLLARQLDEQLGENGEKIQEALDPDREGTPTHRLRENILSEIEDIKKQLFADEEKEELRERTPFSGYDFEDQLQEILEDLVHQTPNQVRDTSERSGVKGDSKTGDFVVTLGDTDQRIVIEAKNGKFSGTVESEMREAIENREADYGIFVASSTEYLPSTKLGWFSEIDQDFVVVALSGEGDDEIDPRFFEFAYHWARTRTLLSAVAVSSELDPEAVKAELDGIEESIAQFRNIRAKCTDLEKSIDDIRRILTEIEDDITSRLTSLEAEMGIAPD